MKNLKNISNWNPLRFRKTVQIKKALKTKTLFIATLIFALSCQNQEVCTYTVVGKQNYIWEIESESRILSQDSELNFPYAAATSELLVSDLTEIGIQAEITINSDRETTVEITSSEVFLSVTFSGDQDGNNLETLFLESNCQ